MSVTLNVRASSLLKDALSSLMVPYWRDSLPFSAAMLKVPSQWSSCHEYFDLEQLLNVPAVALWDRS